MLKELKTFNYDNNEFVVLKNHSCSNSQAQLITIDTDLDNSILFCEDFHPWFSSTTCEFRAINKDIYDASFSADYYLDQIEDLLATEVSDRIINW